MTAPARTAHHRGPEAVPDRGGGRRVPWRLSRLARREAIWGYVFISPWIIGFLWFVLGPMIASFGFTFTNLSLAQEEPLAFIGLRNYQTLLGDKQAWDALAVTVRF